MIQFLSRSENINELNQTDMLQMKDLMFIL